MTTGWNELLAEHARSVPRKRPFFVSRRLWCALGITPPLFAGRRQQQPAPSWRLTMLAEIDEKQGLISTMAIIVGTPLSQGRIVFELLDETGPVNSPVKKPLTVAAPSSILMLPAIPFPEGASGTVSSWRWSVRLESKRGRVLARWSKRLVSAGALNCEAELDI